MTFERFLNSSRSFTTSEPKNVAPFSKVGSYTITVAPFAFTRFITPWIDDWRKLSEFDFIVRRYTPTVTGFSAPLSYSLFSSYP